MAPAVGAACEKHVHRRQAAWSERIPCDPTRSGRSAKVTSRKGGGAATAGLRDGTLPAFGPAAQSCDSRPYPVPRACRSCSVDLHPRIADHRRPTRDLVLRNGGELRRPGCPAASTPRTEVHHPGRGPVVLHDAHHAATPDRSHSLAAIMQLSATDRTWLNPTQSCGNASRRRRLQYRGDLKNPGHSAMHSQSSIARRRAHD